MRGAIRRNSSASASRSLPEPICRTSSASFSSTSIHTQIICVTGKLVVTHPGIGQAFVPKRSVRENQEKAYQSNRHSGAATPNCLRKRRTQMITNQETGTRVDEVADGIYRICTPLDVIPGGFTFNSYLIADDDPVLFHTGYRKLFPITLEAIRKVLPVKKLRWIGGSHFEGDEFGALNDLLAAAPEATPFGTEVGVLTSLNDFATRPARGFGDGEEFSIGSRRMKWLYTPHVPHGWDCSILF